MVQKASTPWSVRTVAEGGTDSPVGDLVPVPDKITPVVSTGFIALSGKYTGLPADDLAFTFQDPAQALGPGADMDFSVDMLKHGEFILAVLDSSGNDINVDIIAMNPTTLTGPYTPFQDAGVNGSHAWHTNANATDGTLYDLLYDTSSSLGSTWVFYKIIGTRGMQIRLLIHNNDGANAGTISTAYLRLL